MKSNKQKGFAIIEIIMAVVMVVLIGAVIYLYIQNNQTKNEKLNTVQSSKPSESQKDNKTSPTPTNSSEVNNKLSDFASFDEESIKDMLLKVYAPAVSGSSQETQKNLLDKYASKSLLKYYKDLYSSSEPVMADPICLCQNSWNKAQVTNVTIDGTRATAKVILDFADPYALTVTVMNENGPKLDTITNGRNRTPYIE